MPIISNKKKKQIVIQIYYFDDYEFIRKKFLYSFIIVFIDWNIA